eukprot:TRINITY_DN3608_c0_g1_i2.p1 TRINITY_DN3608_c0_g1~~TRINITY_DN3608_c0_g1_i2.p1  ORF type:complete len:291 (-),score=59.13 TRINITY_DN3608_c0_g1_i2:186-1058(-)
MFVFADGICYEYNGAWKPVALGAAVGRVSNRICAVPLDGVHCAVMMDDNGSLNVFNPVTGQLTQPFPSIVAEGLVYYSKRNCLVALGCDNQGSATGVCTLDLDSSAHGAKWTAAGVLLESAANAAFGLIEDKIYIASQAFTLCYDVNTASCTRRSGRADVFHAGCCVFQNKVYIAGGDDGHSHVKHMRCYDPVTDMWTVLADMCNKRRWLSLVQFKGRLWAIGGSSVTEDHDVETDKWCEEFKDRLWAAEGSQAAVIETYDVQTNRWCEEPRDREPKPLRCCGAIVLDNM